MSVKPYKKSLFIFRRDLRLQDNNGLTAALQQSDCVIPCFIFDPQQIGPQNKFRSSNAIQFMLESLQDLDKQLKTKKGKLYIFKGNPKNIVSKLINQEKIDAVFLNRDYTPFSTNRDKTIAQICIRKKVEFFAYNDLLLTEPDDIKTGKGTPYTIFTPFFKKAVHRKIVNPKQLPRGNFLTGNIAGSQSVHMYKYVLKKENKKLHVHGGTIQGKKILGSLGIYKNYKKTKDFPSLDTTNLSAYLKFGCISVRETFYAIEEKLGKHHLLIRQLYWRDFFTHIAFHFPFVFGAPYHEKYKKLWWSKSNVYFNAWSKGNTGFPIVDAGMRQLNETGFMHNRVRMIVASFLTKDLHINWLKGEKYFAQQLVDYDPAINNGNWQWSASTGCDAQPYFRIFNPWTQQKKFDPDCIYIKIWIPELRHIPNKIIHTWSKNTHQPIKNYPRPIVDHTIESRKTKSLYKKVD